VKAGAQKGGVVRRVPVYEHAVEIPGVPNPLRLRGEYERGWGGTGEWREAEKRNIVNAPREQ